MILTVGAGVEGAMGGSLVVGCGGVGVGVGCGVLTGDTVKMSDSVPGDGGSTG